VSTFPDCLFDTWAAPVWRNSTRHHIPGLQFVLQVLPQRISGMVVIQTFVQCVEASVHKYSCGNSCVSCFHDTLLLQVLTLENWEEIMYRCAGGCK
jgi:hypothetical protein